jgi:NADH pyrophosphatase NudC (nudix superfamily)
MPQMTFCPWCGANLERTVVDQVERWVCPVAGCGYVFWDNPTPIVAAIVERGHHVILVRNHGWPEKWFGLVSGFLERGETPEQAVRREIDEELSLTASTVELLGLYPFFERNELILAYHAVADGEIVPGDEIAGFKEISIDRLKPWPFGTGPVVRDWLERRRGEAGSP